MAGRIEIIERQGEIGAIEIEKTGGSQGNPHCGQSRRNQNKNNPNP